MNTENVASTNQQVKRASTTPVSEETKRVWTVEPEGEEHWKIVGRLGDSQDETGLFGSREEAEDAAQVMRGGGYVDGPWHFYIFIPPAVQLSLFGGAR